MQDNQQTENEAEGISFKDIFSTIWLRKWVAIGVAVAILLTGVLALYFGYNRTVSNYEIKFSLNLPGEESETAYVYPDGTQFHYADIISLETLKEIKKSDEEGFKNLDVETMTKSGFIHIKRDVGETTSGNAKYSETTYTITARAKCFADDGQARRFLTALSKDPVTRLDKMKIEYGVYLPMAKGADTYESEIGFLKSQIEVLQKGYSELIRKYGGSFVGSDNGKTLLAYSQEIQAYADRGVLNNLLVEARDETTEATNRKPILKSEANRDKYRLELASLEIELADAEKTLETLKNANFGGGTAAAFIGKASANDNKDEDKDQSGNFKSDAQILKEQQDLVNALTNKKAIIKKYIDKGVVDSAFDAKMESAYREIEIFTEIYGNTCKTVYSKSASVVYIQPGIIATTGGMGLITIGVLSLLVAIIVASIAAYVAGRYKLKAMKQQEIATGESLGANVATVADENADGENKEENKKS